MHLTDYDIGSFVKKQINVYLTNDHPAFTTLKSHILNQHPIAQVHSNIVEELTKVRNYDELEEKIELEKLACNKQLIEDQAQQKYDNAERLKDEEQKDRLTRELNHIPTLESSYTTESGLLKLQLNQLTEALQKIEIMYQHEQNRAMHQHRHAQESNQHGHAQEPNQHGHAQEPNQHGHGHAQEPNQHGHAQEPNQHGHAQEPNQHGHAQEPHQHGHAQEPHQHGHAQDPHQHGHVETPTSKALKEHQQAINQLKSTILEYESKIHALQNQKKAIKNDLEKIVRWEEERLARHLKIIEREQARIGFQATGKGVENTLSIHNATRLKLNLSNSASRIRHQYNDLIDKAEKINYTSFLELLPEHLANTKTLSEPEISSLKTTLKLMNQYFHNERETEKIENSLSHKKILIHNQINKLKELNKKLEYLRKENPRLTSENTRLTERNAELTHSLEQNKNLHQRLKGPALLLLVLTILFTIPLILTLNGIIPFFMTPVLVYTLVSVPPALLFLATLATGIAASIYSSRASSDESEINANNKTIKSNNIEMGYNNQNLHNLVATTIPDLEAQIKCDEADRDRVASSLEKSREMSTQLLKQATEIQPVLYSSSSFLEEDRSRRSKESEALATSPEEISMTMQAP